MGSAMNETEGWVDEGPVLSFAEAMLLIAAGIGVALIAVAVVAIEGWRFVRGH